MDRKDVTGNFGEIEHGKSKKTTEQENEGCPKTVGELETSRGKDRPRHAKRTGIQIISRNAEVKQHGDEGPSSQEARLAAMVKSELRKTYLEKRKALSGDERRRLSELIANAFFDSFDLSQTKFLHAFISIDRFNEVDASQIFERLWRDFPDVQTLVPRVDSESNEIVSLRFTRATELVKNTWGIPEPAGDEFVEPRVIDIVLVPGLCFDRVGHRVGYGKGYYDRFLKRCRPDCVKIGLSYFEPVEKIGDVHEGDVAVDFIVTPLEVGNAECGMRNS
jgi:5-formyltetrahydrofolate cyclo-ligase